MCKASSDYLSFSVQVNSDCQLLFPTDDIRSPDRLYQSVEFQLTALCYVLYLISFSQEKDLPVSSSESVNGCSSCETSGA